MGLSLGLNMFWATKFFFCFFDVLGNFKRFPFFFAVFFATFSGTIERERERPFAAQANDVRERERRSRCSD